jgi:hypothetical protein
LGEFTKSDVPTTFKQTLYQFEEGAAFFDELRRQGNLGLYKTIKHALSDPLNNGLTKPRIRFELETEGNWREEAGPITAVVSLTAYLDKTGKLLFNISGPVHKARAKALANMLSLFFV